MASKYGIRIRIFGYESGFQIRNAGYAFCFDTNLISGSGSWCGFKLCFMSKTLGYADTQNRIWIRNPDLITLQIQNPDSQSIYGILIWNPNSNIESGYRIKIRIPVHNPNTKSRNVNRSRIRYFDPESGYEYRYSFQILSSYTDPDSDPYSQL